MHGPIDDQTVDFFQELFDTLFSEPFRARIQQRLKRNQVIRQVEEAADAASQSLTRFFRNEQLTEAQVACVLGSLERLSELLSLDNIASASVSPESLVAELLPRLPCQTADEQPAVGAIYREAMHSVVQVLMLVGPVMAEWQKLSFSTTFELPRRVVARLNQISEQLGALGRSGREALDENYELTYRDFLLQRFHRIEAGTVRMTTNLAVDLSELFVMPRVLPRRQEGDESPGDAIDASALMDLTAARRQFSKTPVDDQRSGGGSPGLRALEQFRAHSRNILIGAPGSGKSTLVEWLQLAVALVSEEFVLAGEQAIPLLLRVRQLDLANLPRGAALVEMAMASKDRATLMPQGWIERMMKAGRVLFLLDGLDETEPELRDEYLIPWLAGLVRDFPECHYVVSSRPVGYPSGHLESLGFVECDLLDFVLDEMNEYTRHWCTAVRLARNEPEQEARDEGAKDGDKIIAGFKGHPYIRDLARNPLMLSAICLVRYFEGGELPKDRAVLYKLCVEGLLHHWDQRRGIHSEYSMEEKLRACRELALAMQLDDRAEYEAEKVRATFGTILGDESRGRKLFDHIRYRAGLLLERRGGAFTFAHLTFQEYLAALAVHEGNGLGTDPEALAREHNDGRWTEVIALYCGLAPARSARAMIRRLMAEDDSRELAAVLTEAYFSSGPETQQDRVFRMQVIERVALAPGVRGVLNLFPTDQVAPIANRLVGAIRTNLHTSEAFNWLIRNREHVNVSLLQERIFHRAPVSPIPLSELIFLSFMTLDVESLSRLADDGALLSSSGPCFEGRGDEEYSTQASLAVRGLLQRPDLLQTGAYIPILIRLLDRMFSDDPSAWETLAVGRILRVRFEHSLLEDNNLGSELAMRATRLNDMIEVQLKSSSSVFRELNAQEIERLKKWVETLRPELTVDPTAGGDKQPARPPRRRSPGRKRSP